MEREENNSHLDNYLQNSQNLMDNLQIASGGGIGIGGGIGNNCSDVNAGFNVVAGAKFEEHEDDEEWKYINEVQQSEKKSELVDNGNETLGADILLSNTIGIGNGYRNNNNASNGNGVDVDLLLDAHQEHNQQQEQQQQYEYDNGLAAANGANIIDNNVVGFGVGASNVIDDIIAVNAGDEEDVEIIKNDGDFSTTSNTTTTNSTTGEENDNNILQVEMKIEAAKSSQFADDDDDDDLLGDNIAPQFNAAAIINNRNDVEEEDEVSSLATNTTNGTSSLSENLQHQQQQQQQQHQQQQNQEDQENIYNAGDYDFDNKENADPLNTTNASVEVDSILNPNAREFVPSFSNPTSPDLIESDSFSQQFQQQQQTGDQEQTPNIVPRHVFNIGVDDFVAQSPSKARFTDMDAISLPGENDFGHEAAKRPHELEREDDNLEQNTIPIEDVVVDDLQQLTLNNENLNNDNNLMKDELINSTEIESHSPSSFIDHGPETSVDLDANIDVMKQSIYIANNITETDENIEELLNTVQQLPNDTDSANNSDDDENNDAVVAPKELLNVEEKENISQSPTIEDIHMNLKNNDLSEQENIDDDYQRNSIEIDENDENVGNVEFNSSTQNIPQIPLDMNNVDLMVESFYIENTSAARIAGGDDFVEKELELDQQQQQQQQQEEEQKQQLDEEININENQHANLFEQIVVAIEPPQTLNITANADEQEQQLLTTTTTDDATPSPYSSEEKHLLEETKEQFDAITTASLLENVIANGSDEIEQKLNDLQLSSNNANINDEQDDNNDDDVIQKQITANISTIENQFYTQESEPQQLFEIEQTKKIVDELDQQQQQQQQPANNEQFLEYEQKEEDVIIPVIQPKALLPEFESEIQNVEQQQEEELQDIVSKVEEIDVIGTKSLKDAIEPTNETIATPVEPLVSQPTSETSLLDTVAAATVATVAAATTAAVGVAIAKKSDVLKKPTAAGTTAKSSANLTKKPIDVKKTPSTTTKSSATARPRTAPTVAATKSTTSTLAVGDKKPTSATAVKAPIVKKTTNTTTAATATSARNVTSSASKTSVGGGISLKSTTSTARVPLTASTARKSPSTTNTANGTISKVRPTTAPAKPTTLLLPSTGGGNATANKTKVQSPRMTLTAQLRKSAPANAKSPTKTAQPTTNGGAGGLSAKCSITSVTSRSKAATGIGSNASNTLLPATTTKSFTARPAPKFTHNTATAARRTATSTTTTTTSSTTNVIKKTSAVGAPTRTVVAKTSSPSKTAITTTSVTSLKNKAKETKPPSNVIGKRLSGANAGGGSGAGTVKIETNKVIKQTNGIAEDNTAKDLLQLNGNNEQQQQQQEENGLEQANEKEDTTLTVNTADVVVGLIDA